MQPLSHSLPLATPAPSIFGVVTVLWRRTAVAWHGARQRRRQRIALAALDERLLRDIGVTPEQARGEAAKPFWRE